MTGVFIVLLDGNVVFFGVGGGQIGLENAVYPTVPLSRTAGHSQTRSSPLYHEASEALSPASSKHAHTCSLPAPQDNRPQASSLDRDLFAEQRQR